LLWAVNAFRDVNPLLSAVVLEVKVDTVPRGNMNYVQDNMFLGQLPKRLVIGCVDSDA
jgi:hypothetical protein